MALPPGQPLPPLLRVPSPDTGQIIDCFIRQYNTAHGDPSLDRWDISKEDWERYEFLGDRIVNLLVARMLFSRRDPALDEGEMTKVLGDVVSNRSLDMLARTICPQGFARLIPPAIGEQNSYGKRITGGAFEAFIGALSCEAGPEDVACYLTAIMAEPLAHYDPQVNAIGLLQEYFQKQGMPVPVYEHVASEGPQHKPRHTYRVCTPDGKAFDGEGRDSSEAKQNAARAALSAVRNDSP